MTPDMLNNKYSTEIKIDGDFEKAKLSFKILGEKKIKFISGNYSGKGRPKKLDYIICKTKNLFDAKAFDLLNHGFKTNYTKK